MYIMLIEKIENNDQAFLDFEYDENAISLPISFLFVSNIAPRLSPSRIRWYIWNIHDIFVVMTHLIRANSVLPLTLYSEYFVRILGN